MSWSRGKGRLGFSLVMFSPELCVDLSFLQSHFYLARSQFPTMDVNILFPEINSFVSKPSAKNNSRSKRRRNRKKEKLRALKRRADEEAKQPSDAPPPRQDVDEEDVKQPSDAPPHDADEEEVKQPLDAPPSLGLDADRLLPVVDDETGKAMVLPASDS